MIIKGGRVLDSVKKCLHACLRARNIWLQWNINRNAPSSKESRAERGVASKFMKWTRLMIIKGGRVLDSVKNACMHV